MAELNEAKTQALKASSRSRVAARVVNVGETEGPITRIARDENESATTSYPTQSMLNQE